MLKIEKSAVLYFVLLSGILSYSFFFGVSAGADMRLLYPHIPMLYIVIALTVKALHVNLKKKNDSLVQLGPISDLTPRKTMRLKPSSCSSGDALTFGHSCRSPSRLYDLVPYSLDFQGKGE
jgi:hypothetical protein